MLNKAPYRTVLSALLIAGIGSQALAMEEIVVVGQNQSIQAETGSAVKAAMHDHVRIASAASRARLDAELAQAPGARNIRLAVARTPTRG